jgi:hypothetical protein
MDTAASPMHSEQRGIAEHRLYPSTASTAPCFPLDGRMETEGSRSGEELPPTVLELRWSARHPNRVSGSTLEPGRSTTPDCHAASRPQRYSDAVRVETSTRAGSRSSAHPTLAAAPCLPASPRFPVSHHVGGCEAKVSPDRPDAQCESGSHIARREVLQSVTHALTVRYQPDCLQQLPIAKEDRTQSHAKAAATSVPADRR